MLCVFWRHCVSFSFAVIISVCWDSSVQRLQTSEYLVKYSENFREKFYDGFLFYHGIVKKWNVLHRIQQIFILAYLCQICMH